MDIIRKTTLEERSLFIKVSLQWDSSKFDGYYLLDEESFLFFEHQLRGNECRGDIKKFLTLLADPLTCINDFYVAMPTEILILELDFFMCDSLKEDFCQFVFGLDHQTWFALMHNLEYTSIFYEFVDDFLKQLKKTKWRGGQLSIFSL